MPAEADRTVPLVSVLIPAYNHARFLGATLDSVLQDGYPRIELLVLDDGSRDATPDVAREWGRRNAGRVEAFRSWSQENRGICRTLNRLVGESHGEFLVLLASDDLLVPGSIAHRVKALQANPRWLAVFGESSVIDETGRLLHDRCFGTHKVTDRFALADPELRSWEIILRWPLCGSITAYRRTAFDATVGVGPFDESLVTEDRDMYLRLLAKEALGYTEEVVSQYRLHPTNFMKSDASRWRAIEASATSERANAHKFAPAKRMALLVGSAWRHVRVRYVQLEGRGFRAFVARVQRVFLAYTRLAIIAWHDRRIARAKRRLGAVA